MRSPLLLVAVLVFALTPQSGNGAETRDAVLDALLSALHDQVGVPALSAAVSVRGESVWHGQAGFADVAGQRVATGETVFRLASVSKAVCGIMAARLVEDGVVGIDTEAGDLMPDLPSQYHELTLRDLMTHTSGLPHYEARDFARGRKNYSSAIAGLEQLGDRDLVSAPGSSYLYSSHGYSLAGAIMEKASGKSFVELLDATTRSAGRAEAVVLESLNGNGRQRTLIYEGVENGGSREIQREDFSYSWCGAGMEATAVELSDFASSAFGPDGLLEPDGLKLLSDPLLDRDGDVVQGDRWVMTLGWRRTTDVNGEPYLHHAGVTNGARSILAVWPESGLAVTLLSNASWTGRMEDTAVAFALAASSPDTAQSCPSADDFAYSGTFRDSSIAAIITWQDTTNVCRGRLRGDSALTEWLGRFNFASPTEHALVQLSDDKWGLVSPIGISVLSGDPAKLSGFVGSGAISLSRRNIGVFD